jgi:hypothetical protein
VTSARRKPFAFVVKGLSFICAVHHRKYRWQQSRLKYYDKLPDNYDKPTKFFRFVFVTDNQGWASTSATSRCDSLGKNKKLCDGFSGSSRLSTRQAHASSVLLVQGTVMKTLKGRASPTFAVKAALAIITAVATLASVPAFAQAVIIAPSPPPPMRTEVVPVARPGYVWDGGHWRWAGRGYEWVPGHWRPVRVGAHWVPGHWVQRGPNWRWIEGHWAR